MSTSHSQCPVSAYQETNGLRYFARMLCKIRLHAAGDLREDFHENLGDGLDARFCKFLRLDYAALVTRTLAGGTDEEILTWCEAQTRPLSETDKLVWNHYVTKLGWRDQVTASLANRKAQSGLSNRDEIETMIEYFEYDEGRKS